MNATQVRYAKERATAIKRDLSNKILAKYKAKELSTDERIAAIRAGKFKVRHKITRTHYLCDVFEIEGEKPADTKGQEKALTALADQYTKLIDELVLGDNEEALRLLKTFATTTL